MLGWIELAFVSQKRVSCVPFGIGVVALPDGLQDMLSRDFVPLGIHTAQPPSTARRYMTSTDDFHLVILVISFVPKGVLSFQRIADIVSSLRPHADGLVRSSGGWQARTAS